MNAKPETIALPTSSGQALTQQTTSALAAAGPAAPCPHCGSGHNGNPQPTEAQYARLQTEIEQLTKGWLDLEIQQRELLQERAKLPHGTAPSPSPAGAIAAVSGTPDTAAPKSATAGAPSTTQPDRAVESDRAERVDGPVTSAAAQATENAAPALGRLSERAFESPSDHIASDPSPQLRSLFGLQPRTSRRHP